jgi:hypothetical protein
MILCRIRRRRRRLARRLLRRGVLAGLGLLFSLAAAAQSAPPYIGPGASMLGPGARMAPGPLPPLPPVSMAQPLGPGVVIGRPGALPTTITPAPGGATSDSATVGATTVNPFGPAGQPPNSPPVSLVQPYGEGAIINTPGQPLVVCTPSGATVVCR